MLQELLEIGQIVNAFGVKGFVKVVPFTDDIHRFDKLKNVYIVTKRNKEEKEIEEVKYHKNMVLIKFVGIDDMDEALKLKESYIKIERKDSIPLPKDTYFIVDLIGLEVYTDDNKKLGILEDIFNTGSNDIYVVKDELGKQILLPAISEVIKNIDIQNKKIIVHLINGLV